MTGYLIPKFYTTASLLKNIARKEQTYFLGLSLGKLRFSKSQKIRPKAKDDSKADLFGLRDVFFKRRRKNVHFGEIWTSNI